MPTPPSAALQAICLRLSQIDNYIVTLVGLNGGNYWPQGGTLDPNKLLIDRSLIALYGFPGTLSGTYLGAIQPYDYIVLAAGSAPGVLGGLELAYGTTPGLVPTATATFNGGSGDDWIVGSKINQSLYGNAGNDVVNGAGGSDTLNGGVNRAEGSSVSGSPWGDTVSFQASGNGVKRWSNPFGLNYTTGTTNFTNPYSTGVVVNLVSHMYSYKGGSGSVVNFESVWGSDGNDTITGDALGDHLYGGAGNDVITTGAGHDWVQGGSGNNTLDGGAGNNWLDYAYLLGGPQYLDPPPISPYFTGGPLLGADQFRNTVKAYTFQTPLSAQFFTLGPRQSLIVDLSVVNASGQSIATISATAGSTALYFQTDRVKNFQAIDGGAGNDIIVGNLATTNIVGNGGDNILYGAGSSASAPAGSLVSPSLTPTTIMGGTGGDLARGPSGNNLILMAAGGNEVVFGYGDGPTPGRKTTISFQTVATSTQVVVPYTASTTTLTPYAGVRGPLFGTPRNVTIDLLLGTYAYNAAFSSVTTIIGGISTTTYPNTLSTGTILGVDNAVGSDGNDRIVANNNNDVLSGGLGDDTLIGGTGDDTLYGGAGSDILTGGAISAAAGDAGINRFYVGFDYMPGLVLAPTDSWINHSTFNTVFAADSITDWYNGHDYLQVSSGSSAAITGRFDPGTPATTNLWSTASRTVLNVGTWDATNWSHDDYIDEGAGILNAGTVRFDAGEGNNTVDLSHNVTNTGTIIVRAGSGNDVITAADNGKNWIYAGSGTNIINLGTDTTIHTDRVYISDFGTQNIVNGFGANDKIYISNKLVDALGGAVKSAPSLSSDVVTGGTQDVATAITVSHLHDQESPSLSGPQSDLAKPIYDPLFWSNLGRLAYGYDYGTPHPNSGIPLLNGSNGDYTSNGGYTNQVMKTSSDQASTQVIAGGSAMIASGYILVATVLLMPAGYALIALGGLTLAGGIIYRDHPPKNGTLDVPLTGYGNTLESGATVTFAKTSWTARDFNGLLQSANTDGLTPTLEVTGQPRYSSIGGSDPAGINTIVAITTVADTTSGYSTMIYLVHSVDNMIQNNEATLLAQVDNKVFASQLVTYTGDTLTPHLAAPVTAITVAGANISGAVPYVVDVNTPTPVLSITVDESAVAINEQYTLYIYDGNTQLAALTETSLGAAGRVISFTDSTFRTRLGVASATTLPPDPQAHYRVSTLSDQGIASLARSYTLVDRTTVIKSIDFTGNGITVNAITAGTLSLTSISGSPTASVTGATDAASGTLTLSSIVAGLNASTYSSPIASSLKMTVGSTTSSSTQMFQLATQNSATLNAVAGVDNGLYALGDFAVVNGSATTTFVTTAGTLTGTSVVVPASSTVLTAGSDVIVAAGSDATINLWDGGIRSNAKIIIAPGSSPLIVSAGSGLASGYDTINHFLLGGAANAYDILQLDNDGTTGQPVIATSLASASAGTITGGTLSDGVITFTGLTADALGSATGATLGTDLTNIQNYLDAALTAGKVVAFRSGSTDSWVFEKGSSASQDTLIKLVGANVQHLVLQTGTTVVGGVTGDLRIA